MSIKSFLNLQHELLVLVRVYGVVQDDCHVGDAGGLALRVDRVVVLKNNIQTKYFKRKAIW